MELKDLPARKTDGALVLDTRKHICRLNVQEAGKQLIKR